MHRGPLFQILILLAAAVGVVAGVRKLAMPAILGYLVVGMLLGPHALAVAADNETTRLLADFGVVFLVFTLGLEFSLPRLLAMRWEVLGVGRRTGDRDHGGGRAPSRSGFDTGPAAAVVIGGAVAMSSTAIIIAQLTEQSENNRTHGRLAVAICLFQDLSFPLFLGLLSPLAVGGSSAAASHIAAAIGIALAALLLVLAAGRWVLRPLFVAIAGFRSAELFSLAVLLAVLASAWATETAGLSLALGAFLAGMMLAETEFRHQIEATIRSYREIFLGLFFITVGMMLDVRLLLRTLPLVSVILLAMLVLKTAVVTVAAEPSTKSWFKSLRTGVIVSQGGEFGFALLTLLLRRDLAAPAVVQPLLAATVLSMVASPLLIRHNRRITRAILREGGPRYTEAMREAEATRALAGRDHVVICGFGRVGQNIARVLEQTGFEYIALDVDPQRIRAGRQAGDPVMYGDAGAARGAPERRLVACALRGHHVREPRGVAQDRPIGARAARGRADPGAHSGRRQAGRAAGRGRHGSRAGDLRGQPHAALPSAAAAEAAGLTGDPHRERHPQPSLRHAAAVLSGPRTAVPDDSHAFREELHSVILPPHAWAVGKSIAELAGRAPKPP